MLREYFLNSVEEKDERLESLKKLYPEIFSDGKINLDAFKDATGTSDLPEDEDKTPGYYGLYWPGKRAAKQLAQKPATGTLQPVPGDGVNEDSTHNIYIEGDNLEVLRTLRNSYRGRVKLIYIDPPYNTGHDFIYEDDYSTSVQSYLKLTGQIDDKGNKIVSNPKSSGAFHRRWLNMMLPRLILSRDLLKEDGLIFISIDDNELANLKEICNEVFGEENFEGHIHWRRRHNQPNDKNKLLGIVAEHILVYAKNLDSYKESGVGKVELTANFSNPDNDPKGPWASKPWMVGSDQSGSKYDIQTPTGKILKGEWMGEESTYRKYLEEGRIYFPKNGDGMPRKKYYEFERKEEGQCASNWWPCEQFGHNQGGNDEMTSLFGIKNIFSNPKPTKLLLNIIRIANVKDNDIILDFFSGSSSTADAAMQYASKCKFIMVQIPENLDSFHQLSTGDVKKQAENAINFLTSINKPHTLCEIAKERIRRVGKKIQEENSSNLSKGNLIDFGFKVYRFDKSNFKKFTPIKGQDKNTLKDVLFAFDNMVDPLIGGWKPENVLEEIKLRQGFALDCKVEKVGAITSNKVWHLEDPDRPISLYVCLDEKIEPRTVEELNVGENDKFICLNSAIDDTTYARLVDKNRVQTL